MHSLTINDSDLSRTPGLIVLKGHRLLVEIDV
jgi:hypothetical protein